MRNTFISVTRGNNTPVLPGSNFTQNDFHGLKSDTRNKIPQTHTIDSVLVRAAQTILSWAEDIYGTGKIKISITSTRRTPEFNTLISTSGAKGSHVLGIAMDFVFTGSNAQDAWCRFKNQVIEEGPLLTTLLSIGIGGIGVYGKTSGGQYFFHIDTRTAGDGLPRAKILGGRRYGLWTRGELSCTVAQQESNENNPNQLLERERERASDPSRQVQKYVQYNHPDEQGDLSVEDLITNPLFIGKDLTKEALLQVDKDGVTNNERLYRNLSIKRKRELNQDSIEYNNSVEYPVTPGVTLYIPFSLITTGVEYSSNFTSTKTSYNDFFPPVLKKLTTDPGYIPAYLNRGVVSKQIRPQLRVFIWSRAKYLENGSKLGFIDITEDILEISTTNTIESGGDFSVSLSGVSLRRVQDEQGETVSIEKPQVTGGLTKSNINKKKVFETSGTLASEYRRTVPYYQRVIRKNDLIFISYEKLKIDGPLEDSIEGKWYDMIGLVESPEQSSSANNEVSIVVRGRSLIGALMDDHSYFNPVSIGHESSIYGGDPLSNGRYLDSGFYELSSILSRSIRENIEFIFHRISTIGYVPDDIFTNFKNRTIVSKYTKNTEQGSVEEENIVRGIWQIMNIFIDSNISKLRLADSSISNPQGSILDLIRKTCQDPFVEFFTDTYGDRFYLIARKPPFEQLSTIEAVSEINEEVDDTLAQYAKGSREPIGGADTESVNRYLEELNFEYKKNKKKNGGEEEKPLLLDEVVGLDTVNISTTSYPKIININEDDIIEETLQMSSRGYAWYQVEEQGNFLGAKMGIGIVPAIYFDEIAQAFGNRRLTVVSNYTSLNFYLDGNIDSNRNLYAEQVAQQLAFLVETNIHLPFTREGQIVINPDRRIKVGNYIYHRGSREIFYVTGVTNSYSISGEEINRTTTVSVERGMKLTLVRDAIRTIKTSEGQSKEIEVSYFKIVDIDKLKEQVYDIVSRKSVDGKFNYKGNVEVNKDVFNFFLQNRQFDEDR